MGYVPPEKKARDLVRYGRAHRLARAALRQAAYGEVCHLCGQVMRVGQKLALDHTPDGTSYRGMAHARCNNRDGGRRGIAMRRRRGSAIPPM